MYDSLATANTKKQETSLPLSSRDIRIVMESHLFKGIASSFQEKMLAQAKFHFYRRGEFLYQAREDVDCFYFLLEGTVKELYLCDTGKEYLRHLALQGQFIGLHKVFSANDAHHHHCQTVTKARLLSWRKETFLREIYHEPEISIRVACLLSSYYDESCRNKCLCQRTKAQSRVAGYLLSRLYHESNSHRKHLHCVDLRPLTCAAEEIHLSRESFSRKLRALQEKGIIELQKGKVIIKDIEALKRE